MIDFSPSCFADSAQSIQPRFNAVERSSRFHLASRRRHLDSLAANLRRLGLSDDAVDGHVGDVRLDFTAFLPNVNAECCA